MTNKTAPSLLLGFIVSLAAALFAGLGLAAPQGPADLVLRHGRVVTVDPARPEAQAVAIVGDRIAAAGSDAEIQPLIGPKTEVIDLGYRHSIPLFSTNTWPGRSTTTTFPASATTATAPRSQSPAVPRR